eukprot:SAG31_NODE_2685_length_5256_cov_2.839442_3_plen_1432_part_01
MQEAIRTYQTTHCSLESAVTHAASGANCIRAAGMDAADDCNVTTDVIFDADAGSWGWRGAGSSAGAGASASWADAESSRLCQCTTAECLDDWFDQQMMFIVRIFAAALLAEILASVFAWNVMADPMSLQLQVDGVSVAPLKRHGESGLVNVARQAVVHEARTHHIKKTKKIVTDSWYFEGTVLASVVMSMIVLALQSPAFPPDANLDLPLRMMEFFVTVFLSMELSLELAANSLQGTKKMLGFFRNPWHLVDMFVLVVSWAYIYYPTRFVGVCRALRVLRPMRTVRIFESVSIVWKCVVDDLVVVRDVSLLCCMLLSAFALIALTCFHGSLQHTCVGPCAGSNNADDVCFLPAGLPDGVPDRLESGAELLDCPSTLQCASEGETRCAELASPRQIGGYMDPEGLRNFDNFLTSLMSMAVHMSADGGMQDMPQALADARASSDWVAWPFFAVGTIVLSLVAMNLMLAVCVSALSSVNEIMYEKKKKAAHAERVAAASKPRAPESPRSVRIKAEVQKTIKVMRKNIPQVSLEDPVHGSEQEQRDIIMKRWDDKRCGTLRNFAHSFVLHPLYRVFSTLTIVAYVFCLLLYSEETLEMGGHDMTVSAEVVLYLEATLVVFFVLEFVLSMLALGWDLFTNTTENVMDMVFLVLTILGTVAVYQNKSEWVSDVFHRLALSDGAMRAMRLGRVTQAFRMLYKEKSMFEVMSTILTARKGILGVFIFVSFSIAMLSIITMHLFGGSLPAGTPYQEYPRSNFETFSSAMLASMQFMVGLEWSKVMLWYKKHAAYGMVAGPYFCFMFFWVHGILYSLFVAVLLINFSVPEDAKIPTQRRKYAVYERQQLTLNESRLRKALTVEMAMESEASTSLVDQLKSSHGYNDSAHRSLYIFNCTNPVRIFCAKIEQNPWSTNSMLILIAFSLAAATQESGEGNHRFHFFFRLVESCILILFFMEMIVKTIVGGFFKISGPTTPYLWRRRNVNNFVVLVIIAATWIPFIADNFSNSTLQSARSLLPMIGLMQHPGINRVVESFLNSIPSVGTVSVPIIFCSVVFSIVGVEYFGGRFKQCVCPSDMFIKVEGSGVCCPGEEQYQVRDSEIVCTNTTTIPVVSEETCLSRGYSWQNPPNVGHFDDVVSGLKTLFKICTADYIEVMYISMDVSDKGTTRIENNAFWYASFYLVVQVVFNFFLLNLFIGVMAHSFSVNSGQSIITKTQKRWIQCLDNCMNFYPINVSEESWRPERIESFGYKSRIKLFDFVTSQNFDRFSYFMIALNCGLLFAEHYPAASLTDMVLSIANTIVLAWFTLEMVLKLIAFGPSNYFSDGWLTFDAAVVFSSLILRFGNARSGVEFLKVFRCLRLLFLAQSLDSLVDLMHVVAISIKKAANVVVISIIIFYIYATIGKEKFGAVPLDGNRYVNGHDNFSTFFNTLQLLFQVACGQN